MCKLILSNCVAVSINPLCPNLNFARVHPVPNLIQNDGVAIANLDSSNLLRFILIDEAMIQGNINCTVVNKDVGMLSHNLKLLQARLDEEDRKIDT